MNCEVCIRTHASFPQPVDGKLSETKSGVELQVCKGCMGLITQNTALVAQIEVLEGTGISRKEKALTAIHRALFPSILADSTHTNADAMVTEADPRPHPISCHQCGVPEGALHKPDCSERGDTRWGDSVTHSPGCDCGAGHVKDSPHARWCALA